MKIVNHSIEFILIIYSITNELKNYNVRGTEIEKLKFHYSKHLINKCRVDIDKMIIFNKVF